MTGKHGAYELNDDLDRVDFERVHAWLATSYWTPGIARERVERAANNSTRVISAYLDGIQVAYMRVISDKTTFGWVCDVWVDEEHRGKGLAKAMVRWAIEHPDYVGLRRWILATKDAHSVYAECGFEPLPEPQRWMIKPAVPGVY
jgi:GNAT superfamily N-acetyltransferase